MKIMDDYSSAMSESQYYITGHSNTIEANKQIFKIRELVDIWEPKLRKASTQQTMSGMNLSPSFPVYLFTSQIDYRRYPPGFTPGFRTSLHKFLKELHNLKYTHTFVLYSVE